MKSCFWLPVSSIVLVMRVAIISLMSSPGVTVLSCHKCPALPRVTQATQANGHQVSKC